MKKLFCSIFIAVLMLSSCNVEDKSVINLNFEKATYLYVQESEATYDRAIIQFEKGDLEGDFDKGFVGQGCAFVFDLNVPKNSQGRIMSGTYTCSGAEEDFVIYPGFFDEGEGLWRPSDAYIRTSSAAAVVAPIETGSIELTTSAYSCTMKGKVTVAGKVYSLSYSGVLANFEGENNGDENGENNNGNDNGGGTGGQDENKLPDLNIESLNYTKGHLEYYGQPYNNSATGYSDFIVLMGSSNCEFTSTDDFFMLELLTSSSYTNSLPAGTYTVASSIDDISTFKAFTVVPAYEEQQDDGYSYCMGTWLFKGNDYYGPTSGTVEVTYANSKYTFKLNMVDSVTSSKITGTVTLPLEYFDYSNEVSTSSTKSVDRRFVRRKINFVNR